MKCETVQDDLSAYLDGELPADARAAVDSHIKECPACQSMLEELKSVACLVAESPRYTAPAHFTETVHRRVAASPAPLIVIGGATPSLSASGSNSNGGYQPRSMWGPVALGIAALVMLFVLAFAVMPALDRNVNSNIAARGTPRAAVEETTGRPETTVADPEAPREIPDRGLDQEVLALRADKLQSAPHELKKLEAGEIGGREDANRRRQMAATRGAHADLPKDGAKDAEQGGGKGEGGGASEKRSNNARAFGAKAAESTGTDKATVEKADAITGAEPALKKGGPELTGQALALSEGTQQLRKAAETESKTLAVVPPKPLDRNGAANKAQEAVGVAPTPAPTAAVAPAPGAPLAGTPAPQRLERNLADAAPGQNGTRRNDPDPLSEAGARTGGARESRAQDGARSEKAKEARRAAPEAPPAPKPSAADLLAKKGEAAKPVTEVAKAVEAKQAGTAAPAAKAEMDGKSGTASPKKQGAGFNEEVRKAAQAETPQLRRTFFHVPDRAAFLTQLKAVVQELGGEWAQEVKKENGDEQATITLPARKIETFQARLKELKSATVLDLARPGNYAKVNASLAETQTPEGKDIFLLTLATK